MVILVKNFAKSSIVIIWERVYHGTVERDKSPRQKEGNTMTAIEITARLDRMEEVYLSTRSTAIHTIVLNSHGDPMAIELTVEFNGGRWYAYEVPVTVAVGLATADSVGRYYSANIRGRYVSTRVE